MESEPPGTPRKQVVFHSSDQIYSASSRDYDERSDSMISSQQSFRPHIGNGMPRSQASYAVNETYANINLLEQRSAGARDSIASNNTFNSKSSANHSDNHISDGDYIDSNAAATYMNTHNLQQSQGLTPDGYPPSQGSRQSSYRDPPPPNRGKLYDSQVTERAPPRSSESSVRGSSDRLGGSRGSLVGSREFGGSRELRSSRDKLAETGSRSGSIDHLNRDSYPEIEEDEYLQQVKMGRLNSAFEDDNYPNQTADSYRYQTQPEHSNNYGVYNGMNRNDSSDYIDEGETRRLFGSHHSLHNGHDPDQKWRPPDLPEVIEYLSHPNDIIKANAAAYLQHLCYGNHHVKSQTRALKGIPALVALLSHPLSEVHRNSLGALLNLSRGYENDDNKRDIRSCEGLEKLTRLLEASEDNDVRELVSGILWNMSSLQELKKPVMNICLNTIVKMIIIPSTGLQSYTLDLNETVVINWSTEFRNATGVIRNLSSDGHYARKNLRECDGLIECLLRVAQAVIGRSEMDNKPVENVVCTLRNLSYRLMEIDYPGFYDKQRTQLTTPQPKRSVSLELIPGCFGKSKQQQPENTIEYPSKTPPGRQRGEQLWQKEVVEIYLPLLSDCSNTDTLEAAVGAIQNLAACEWEPSMRIREHVRKQKGLPTVVELLGLEEADGVVCGAAIALRNLAIDKSNKTLIGKYAIRQLVSRLPTLSADMSRTSEETVRAVLATLYEVFKIIDSDSGEHARTLIDSGDGLSRLVGISKSNMKYSAKTLKGTHHVLSALWRFSGLRASYKNKGFKESDFLNKNMLPRPGTAGTMSLSSTLTRPRSEPPSNTNTINRNSGTLRADNSEFRQLNGNGRSDDRAGLISDFNMERNPSTNTLPIQRPIQQPYEDRYYTEQTQPQYTGSYKHVETSHSYRDQFNQAHSYPDLTQPDVSNRLQGYANSALLDSFSQSREGLQFNSNSYLQNLDYPAQGEPLYARVDKRRSQTIEHVAFPQHHTDSRAISLNSLNNQQIYSYETQPETPAADSWV